MAAAAPPGLRPASAIPTCMVWPAETEPAGGSVSMPLNTPEGSGVVVTGRVTVAPGGASLPFRAWAAAVVAAVALAVLPLAEGASAPGPPAFVADSALPVRRLEPCDGPHAPRGTARRAPATRARARLRMCRSSTHRGPAPAGGGPPRLPPSRRGAVTVERVVNETVERVG